MAQSVERRLGKAEVTGSIPVISFFYCLKKGLGTVGFAAPRPFYNLNPPKANDSSPAEPYFVPAIHKIIIPVDNCTITVTAHLGASLPCGKTQPAIL